MKPFGKVSVLTPTESLFGFRGTKVVSIGYAYVIFETPQLAATAFNELHKTEFKGRTLYIKPYEEFIPFGWRTKWKKKVRNEEDAVDTQLIQPKKVSKKETSTDILYCSKLPKDVTDEKIRALFREFNPQEIWIYKQRTNSKCLPITSQITAALVKVNTTENVEAIAAKLTFKKIMNKRIRVAPALVEKVKEIRSIADQLANTESAETIEEVLVVQDADDNNADESSTTPLLIPESNEGSNPVLPKAMNETNISLSMTSSTEVEREEENVAVLVKNKNAETLVLPQE